MNDEMFAELMKSVAQMTDIIRSEMMWKQAFINERAQAYRTGGMKIEQARIHAEADAAAGGCMYEREMV